MGLQDRGLYSLCIVTNPAQSMQESTWIGKDRSWPRFKLRIQNASVLECALEAKHSGAQGTLSTSLSDDKKKQDSSPSKEIIVIEEKASQFLGIGPGKISLCTEVKSGWVDIQGTVKHKLVTQLFAEEQLGTTEEMHPGSFSCGGRDSGNWRKGDYFP